MPTSTQFVASNGFSAPIRAAAFDMDGLMFDTETVYWNSATELLRRRGRRYTQEVRDAIMGRPPEFCMKYFIKTYGLVDDWQELRRESEELNLFFLRQGYATTPGLSTLLDELERLSIPRCVFTGSARYFVDEALKKDGLGERFEFVITSDDVARGKPSPDIYLEAARRLNVEPREMLVLEDSASGCESALSSGAICCMLRASHNATFDFSRAAMVVERLDAPPLLDLLRAR